MGDSKLVISAWLRFGRDQPEAASSAKGIRNIWPLKFSKDDMVKLPTSSGKFASVMPCLVIWLIVFYRFGMTMLETAANIVVPGQ